MTDKLSPAHITDMINNNQLEEALNLLSAHTENSLWLRNARAVCLLRLNRPQSADQLLTDLVYEPNTVSIKANLPDAIKLNLVAAMFLCGNLDGAMHVLGDVKRDLPMKQSLENAFAAWKKKLPFFARLGVALGMLPYDQQIKLDFVPGLLNLD